jgi:hypothetical protein
MCGCLGNVKLASSLMQNINMKQKLYGWTTSSEGWCSSSKSCRHPTKQIQPTFMGINGSFVDAVFIIQWSGPAGAQTSLICSRFHSIQLCGKLLLISQVHLFSEGFSPLYNFFAVILNYSRILTIKIGVDEPRRPQRLDYLAIIDPQQQGDCQTRSCWPGSSSSRTSSTSRPYANSPLNGPPHQGYTSN